MPGKWGAEFVGNYIGRPDANQRGRHHFVPSGVTISSMNIHKWTFGLAVLWAAAAQGQNAEQTVRLPLKANMIRSESELANFAGLVDEQDAIGDPPKAAAKTPWLVASQNNKQFPFAAVLDLGMEKHLSALWFFDTNNIGDLAFYGGKPGEWKAIAEAKTDRYMSWQQVPLNAATRYLRIELKSPAAIFTELVLYAYTDAGFKAMQTRLEAEKRDLAERETAIANAKADVL